MKSNTIVITIIALLLGGVIGYTFNKPEQELVTSTMDHTAMGHTMIDMSSMSMESMMMDMTARMKGKSGDELDIIFLEDMIIHHQGAVDMAYIIRDNTERQELKDFAQEIIDVQDEEINMMNAWLQEWFNR